MNTIAQHIPARPIANHAVQSVLRTEPLPGMTILRLALAGILFPHGAQHLLGWFGGYGFSGTHQWMTGIGFPSALATVAIVGEFVAPFALALGLGGRLAAAFVVALMAGAVATHAANGFFMNWFGSLPAGAEGYEYHLLVIAMAVTIVVHGSGQLSLDRALSTGSQN